MSQRTMWVKGIVALSVSMLPLAAIADAAGDAMEKACPSLQTWQDNLRKHHPELSGERHAEADAKAHFTDPPLHDEIHRRFEEDQKARFASMAHPNDAALGKKVMAVDIDNLAWMRPLFTRQGFPSLAAVGYQGASEAFTLIQHADTEPAFQASMLAPLHRAADKGEVDRSDLAMLTDRVLRHEGKPQRYGSQYDIESTSPLTFALQPTEDEAHLEQRRADMHLPPRATYECMLRVMYTPAG